MPGLSGWDVAREARARWPDLPVLLLTGWGRDVSPAQLREHGVLLALAKPAELPALRAALARALRPAPAAAPLEILLVDDARVRHRPRRAPGSGRAQGGRVEAGSARGRGPGRHGAGGPGHPGPARRPSVECCGRPRPPRGPAVCVVQRQRPGVDGDGRAGGRPVRGEGLRAGAAGAHLRAPAPGARRPPDRPGRLHSRTASPGVVRRRDRPGPVRCPCATLGGRACPGPAGAGGPPRRPRRRCRSSWPSCAPPRWPAPARGGGARALAVWEGAAERGDVAQAREAVAMVAASSIASWPA